MNSQQARALVEETFPKAFDKVRFHQFAKELLNGFNDEKSQAMQVPDAYAPHVRSCARLGTYEAPDGELADVLIVHTTEPWKLERTRTALRDFVAHKLKRGDSYKEAGLVAFVAPDARSWRFSFVRMEYESKRNPKTGKIAVEERLTPARRFSYIVGEKESCHTAQSRFLELLQDTDNKPTLEQIEKAFSVETVTKEFFEQYKALFLDLKDELDAIAKKDKTIGAEFAEKKVSTADFGKKLMGQIVFLYFLQKKGWLGVAKGGDWGDGTHNFLRQLFDGKFGRYKNFFNDILEPLFYDTLATDRGHDAWCNIFKCRIPFLNGGLFEPVAGYDWKKTDITIPNSLFSNSQKTEAGDGGTGILDVFDRYNFTVNEAEPLEKEVAIDPEMLGKVFENLLEVKERKSKGSFYTPREIVHYMCQESLINYLDTTINSKTELVGTERRKQGLLGDEKAEQTFLTVPTRGELIPRADIETFIHSGDQASHYEAARMDGTSYKRNLPKTIETHAKLLDEKLADIAVCDPAIGSGAFPVGMMQEIVRARSALTAYFNDVKDRTSYHFKRHAIQSCIYGVDIDSGAVEIAKLRLWLSLVVDEEDVKQIKPLPNLDYKIVTGNSLMGFPFKSQRLYDIEKLKLKFFDEPDHDSKAKLKQQIELKLKECFAASKKSLGYEVSFDFEVYFSEIFDRQRGFDVLIGNPPYGVDFNETEKAYIRHNFVSYKYKFESYVYFIERALHLAKRGGCITYITPELWLKLENCAPLRQKIANTAAFRVLRVCGEDVFAQAVVNTVVFVLHKGVDVVSLRVILKDEVWELPTESWKSAPLLSVDYRLRPELNAIVSKIRTSSKPLSDFGQAIQGITPYDRYRGQSAELIKNRGYHFDHKHDSHCGKWLAGGDIARYELNWSGEWLKYGPWLGAPREPKFFEGPRLLFREIPGEGKRIQVTYVEKEVFYHGHSITPFKLNKSSGINIKFLLGIVNSRIASWYGGLTLPNFGKEIFPKVNPQDINSLPIPRIVLDKTTDKLRHDKVVRLAEQILSAKAKDANADVSKMECEIDELVYALYCLTPEEIKIVKGATA